MFLHHVQKTSLFALLITVCSALVFVCTSIMPVSAHAAANSKVAHAFLEKNLNEILTVLKSDAFKNSATHAAARAEIEEKATALFDFTEFAMRTVGPRWKSLNDKERTQFAEAFATLLKANYIGKLDGYSNESIEFVSERASRNGKNVEILTNIVQKNKKIPIAYRMIHKTNWVVYDILVENVSLVKNYRTQFQELLRTESPDALIKRIYEAAKKAQSAS